MLNEYPEWATEKQKEGMKEFIEIANEYGDFDVTFEQERHGRGGHSRFTAKIEWTN